jgi:hypothetical protein
MFGKLKLRAFNCKNSAIEVETITSYIVTIMKIILQSENSDDIPKVFITLIIRTIIEGGLFWLSQNWN